MTRLRFFAQALLAILDSPLNKAGLVKVPPHPRPPAHKEPWPLPHHAHC